MASFAKHVTVSGDDIRGEVHPEKLVIVTGPSFGTAVKFMLLGAAFGAAAVLLLKNDQHKKSAAQAGAREEAAVTARFQALSARAKAVTSRAKTLAQLATDLAAPALQRAIHEGRQAARDTEAEIYEEIGGAPDEKPNLAKNSSEESAPPLPTPEKPEQV